MGLMTVFPIQMGIFIKVAHGVVFSTQFFLYPAFIWLFSLNAKKNPEVQPRDWHL